jgi:hypothetical protein
MRSEKTISLKSHVTKTRARRTEDALAAVIERLESRMMLSAGLPDLAPPGSGYPVGFCYGTAPLAETSTGSGFYWPAGMNDFAPSVMKRERTTQLVF